jgi:hypothetical protein
MGQSIRFRVSVQWLPCIKDAQRTALQIGKPHNLTQTSKGTTMTKPEKVVSTAKAHTTGGREGGASRSDDGRLEVKLSPPGTSGTGTNPEQLCPYSNATRGNIDVAINLV